MDDVKANREYKDSVFALLFRDPDNFLELTNALELTSAPPDEPLLDVTLGGALFMNMQNDVAFVCGDEVVILVEHQSTVNENMPIRMLMYIARMYERIIDRKAIYRTSAVPLPKPRFAVLYNGTTPFPDAATFKLSDAYINPSPWLEASAAAGGFLDLEVPIVNVGAGRNERIVRRSESLSGYVSVVEKVRENERSGMELAEAIKAAVEYCIENGIIADFLTKHSSEVINMLFTEFNMEDARSVWKEEGREEGIIVGREEGIEQGRLKGKIELARKLLAQGIAPDVVAEAAGLSLEDIEGGIEQV
jgi:hypothetical protein